MARLCRAFMLVLMNYGHFLVMTDDLQVEWRHRASRWSREWLVAMTRKGWVRWVVPDDCTEVEAAINAAPFSALERAAALKDVRLVAGSAAGQPGDCLARR